MLYSFYSTSQLYEFRIYRFLNAKVLYNLQVTKVIRQSEMACSKFELQTDGPELNGKGSDLFVAIPSFCSANHVQNIHWQFSGSFHEWQHRLLNHACLSHWKRFEIDLLVPIKWTLSFTTVKCYTVAFLQQRLTITNNRLVMAISWSAFLWLLSRRKKPLYIWYKLRNCCNCWGLPIFHHTNNKLLCISISSVIYHY